MGNSDLNAQFSGVISEEVIKSFEDVATETELIRLNKQHSIYQTNTLVKQKKEVFIEKFKDYITSESEDVQKAFNAISEILPQFLSGDALGVIKSESLQAGQKLLSGEASLFSYAENQEAVDIHQTLGISKETISHFYSAAEELYEQERMEDAKNVLMVITYLAPFIPTYWFSYGLALHQLGKYEEALRAYRLASELNVDNPEPIYYSALVLMDMNEIEDANDALEKCTRLLYQNDMSLEWGKKLKTLRRKNKT